MQDKLVKEHIILGVDPGTLFMGYALLHTIGNKVQILDFGVYDVHKLEDQYARLQREFFFLQDLIDKYHPKYLLHGHVHLNYGQEKIRIREYNGTQVINASEYYVLELPDKE